MQPAERDNRVCKTRMWLEWAAAQIDSSLQFDNESSSQLAIAVYGVLDDPRLAERQDQTIPQHELSISAAMQQHDRLMQQMTHVSEALRALVDLLRTKPCELDWAQLRDQQLSRFSMAEERALFHMMVCESVLPGQTAHEFDVDAGAADSVELF